MLSIRMGDIRRREYHWNQSHRLLNQLHLVSQPDSLAQDKETEMITLHKMMHLVRKALILFLTLNKI